MNKGDFKDCKPIRCDCGKLLAVERDGKIYVYCKRCRQEHEVRAESHRAESH